MKAQVSKMAKSKNAFALRGFDEKRILQRPFFKNLALPVVDDEAMLNFFDVSAIDSAAVMEQRFDNLRKLDERLKDYRQLIKKHRQRLRKFFSEYDMADDEQSKIKLERTAKLLRQYNWFEESAELFNLKFGKLYIEGDKALDVQYRREFARRLKTARQLAGLSQADVALQLGMTRNGYQFYESGARDPSIPTLIRLLKILKCSIDDLIKAP